MTQNYTDIKSTDIVGESLDPIKDRDQANKTNFMGTSFPQVTESDVGMTCVIIKTELGVDYKQVWRLIGVTDNQPSWLLERDLTRGIVYSDNATDKNIGNYQEENTLLTSLSEQEAGTGQDNSNKVPYISANNTFSLADITAKARDFLAAVDAASQRDVLGLGSLATKDAVTYNELAANTVKLNNLALGEAGKCISYAANGTPQLAQLPVGIPVGCVMLWTSTVLPPDGLWVFLYGQQLSKTTYADLWAHASGSNNVVANLSDWQNNRRGSFYNESSTVFRVPDLRNYFIRAWDGPSGPTRNVGSIQGDAIRNITGRAGYGIYGEGIDGAFTPTDGKAIYSRGGGSSDYIATFNASRVVPTANENRPINIALPFIMKAKKG